MTFAGFRQGRRRTGRTYAIIFVLDTELLRNNYPDVDWKAADDEVRRYLTVRGFTRMQGSLCIGDESIDAVRCILTVQTLAREHRWFTPCVRDIRMLRIEENNDLRIALDDDDE